MVRLAETLRSTHSREGAVALDVMRGRMFRLNPTGSRMLELLRSGADAPELTCMLVEEFSADPATAESDTHAFLALLRQHGLLEPQSPK